MKNKESLKTHRTGPHRDGTKSAALTRVDSVNMDAIWIKYPIERKGSTTQTASFWCIVVTALCLLIAFYAVQEQTVSEQSSFDTGSCTANNVDTRIASFSITNFNAASQFTALNCNDTIDAVVTNADLASYRYLVVGNWDSNNALTARTNLFLEFTYQIFGGATVSYRPAIEAETDRAYTFADDDFVAKCETFIAKAPDQYGPTCGRTAGTTCIDRCSMEYSKNVSVSDLLPWDVFNVTTLDYNITKKDMDLMMDEIRFECCCPVFIALLFDFCRVFRSYLAVICSDSNAPLTQGSTTSFSFALLQRLRRLSHVRKHCVAAVWTCLLSRLRCWDRLSVSCLPYFPVCLAQTRSLTKRIKQQRRPAQARKLENFKILNLKPLRLKSPRRRPRRKMEKVEKMP